MPLLALLLIYIPDAFFTTYAPSPSHFAGNSHHEQIQFSLKHITSSWGLEEFYCRNELFASNNTATASAPHQRCQHLLKGALLLANSTTDLWLFWWFSCDSSGAIRDAFPQLTPCYQVDSEELASWTNSRQHYKQSSHFNLWKFLSQKWSFGYK